MVPVQVVGQSSSSVIVRMNVSELYYNTTLSPGAIAEEKNVLFYGSLRNGQLTYNLNLAAAETAALSLLYGTVTNVTIEEYACAQVCCYCKLLPHLNHVDCNELF